jgi:biotin-dependent carboxylase-like uncharacterized protein
VRALEVLASGPFASVQDLGRPGRAELGVGASGAADRGALRLANRLVGNPEGAAAVETTFGGLDVRAVGGGYVAATGAPGPLTVEHGGRVRPVAANTLVRLPDGARLRCGVPDAGLRGYLAVRGGVDVAPVLGSRSTDTMAGIGPDPLRPGVRLPVGAPSGELPAVDYAPVAAPESGTLTLRIVPGPRDDWFTDAALAALTGGPYDVTSDSDRIGMRLSGPRLHRARTDELPSEGMVRGALQVPPSELPTLLLADHPVTGGYPVIAVVVAADADRAAQARPGQRVRFRRSPGAR